MKQPALFIFASVFCLIVVALLRRSRHDVELLRMPYWFALGVCVAIAALAARWRQRGGHDLFVAHCHRCGCDLRSTFSCCPDCGTEAMGLPF
jgi:hypothetical protein